MIQTIRKSLQATVLNLQIIITNFTNYKKYKKQHLKYKQYETD